mgnify:CR=1 FL=1
MLGIGTWEVVVVCVLALLLFGPRKLPELARTIGRGMRELRKAGNEVREQITKPFNEDEA